MDEIHAFFYGGQPCLNALAEDGSLADSGSLLDGGGALTDVFG